MTTGHNHRHPSGHMVQAELKQDVPFFIRKQKLFGIIREDADAVHTLIDHAVQHPFLGIKIETSVFLKRGWSDGEYSLVTDFV